MKGECSGCKTMNMEREKEIREVSIARFMLNTIIHFSLDVLFVFFLYHLVLLPYILLNNLTGTFGDHPETLIILFTPSCIFVWSHLYFKTPLALDFFRFKPKIKIYLYKGDWRLIALIFLINVLLWTTYIFLTGPDYFTRYATLYDLLMYPLTIITTLIILIVWESGGR